MKLKAMTSRERWLVALLPAVLVLIVSFILPTGKAERDQLQGQLERARSDAELQAEAIEHSKTANAARAEIERLDLEIARLDSLAAKPTETHSPIGVMSTMPDRFQYLGKQLSSRGITIMATEMVALDGAARSDGSTMPRTWKLTVASTWPQLTNALSASDVLPPGLRIDTVAMDPPQSETRLRRWVITLSATDRESPL